MTIAAQAGQLPARVSPEPPVDPKIIQRFAKLQEPNMGIQLTGPNLAMPGREFAVQAPLTQPPIQTPVTAPKNPMAGMTVSDTRVPGVRRVDGGSSPLFTNIDPTKAVQEMQGGTVNSVPAAAFKGMGGASGVGGGSGPASAALQAAAGRGDWDAIQKYYQSNGGTWLGKTEKQSQGQDLMRTAQRVLDQQMASEKGQPVDVIKQMAELQNGASGDATAAAQLEGQGIQNEQSRMMLDLTQKAIAGDPKALAQLQGLQGKDAKNPTAALLQELMKAWAEGSASGMGGGAPLDQMLREAWPMLQMAATGQLPAAGPATPPPPNETRGTYQGVPGVVRNGQFIPD